MFFDFRDSDGTPLSRYRVFYADLLSFNVTRSAANGAVMLVYNQADTWLASGALGALSLMSSTGTVLSALGDVYHRVFGKVFEIVPPAAVMALALMAYIAWAFVDRRANVRSLGEDRNRIAVAVVLAVWFSWLLRNPFYLMDRALNAIPNLVVDFVNERASPAIGASQAKGSGISGYLMDSVIRPVTQSLMYGHLLTGQCVHDFSLAMNRGNAPGCAPAVNDAPQGAALAAVVLGAFFVVLLAYGLVMLAMYVYHATLAAWSWFSLLYVLTKALFDVKAFVMPSRRLIVAAGHTLAAAVVIAFAVAGPAVSIAIVNSMTDGEPTFSVILYIPAVGVLFFLARQATGAVVRKTGAVHGDPHSIMNRIMAPRSMLGAEAATRRREAAADVAAMTSRAATYMSPMLPGAAVLAAGAAAVESRMRPGATGPSQKEDASRMPTLSDADRETVDGAMDVIVVGEGREKRSEKVTWPPAVARPPKPVPVAAVDEKGNESAAVTTDLVVGFEHPGLGRHHVRVAEDVDVASPAVFGGFGPHRLTPEEPRAERGIPDSGRTQVRSAQDAQSWVRQRAGDVAARSAAVFANLGTPQAGEGEGVGVEGTDDLIAPMVRTYGPVRPHVQAAARVESAPSRYGREAVHRSAADASKRERARYVLAASGKDVVLISADGDPLMRVYMYNDGTHNVVDPCEGEYVMGHRF